ncbi:MAG: type II secretion system F family protein, partial [Actinomycetota bacterium]
EFRRATNDFIQLVAVGLTTDQSVEQAIEFALGVGDSEMFSLLRAELATAPLRGVPLWEALEQLGATYDQRELSELGASIERQGMQGVSITDTVNALAESMRAKALDDLEREADKANANLAGPTVGFVVTTVVFLAYPLAIRIGEAFGG